MLNSQRVNLRNQDVASIDDDNDDDGRSDEEYDSRDDDSSDDDEALSHNEREIVNAVALIVAHPALQTIFSSQDVESLSANPSINAILSDDSSDVLHVGTLVIHTTNDGNVLG